ncbi:MAG: hypothetical protein IIA65_02215 [Planctomycetes bacterium]|nr:hypothetical protein [Planctomycetota bacterium]
MDSSDSKDANEFEANAQGNRVSLLREFWDFLKHNKKWWLLPILIVVLLLGLIVFLAGTPAAPFIYPLF